MAKSIMDFLEPEKRGKMSKTEKSIEGLIELLFKAQVETHITHILQRKKYLVNT